MNFDFAQARENMVEQQVRPWDVLDMRVLDVIARMPREKFVPEAQRTAAYADLELPLGHGEYMMKPVVEGRTLQALNLQPHERVLEIGTGSGYLTACMSQLAGEVRSLEIRADFAHAATAALASQNIGNASVEVADALSWQADAPFDVICVTAAVASVPPQFLTWLKSGGRMFVIQGESPAQEAVLIHADVNGTRTESLFETDLPYLRGAEPRPRFTL